MSAVLGGVTGFFEMPNTIPLTISKTEFDKKIKRASEVSFCDFAFFMGASEENINTLKDIENLPGCCGIKIFMGSSTGNLLIKNEAQMEQIFASTTKVISLHCEDEDLLIENMKNYKKEGLTPHDHPLIRDVNAALSATKRAVKLSHKLNRDIHILHVSTKEEVAFLKENKTQHITVEVTPQHLTLFAPDCYDKLGSLAQMNPPLRGKDHNEGIWQGLNEGVFDILGSDHAPHLLKEKEREYPKSPSGMPGVQTIVPIMLNHIHEKRFSLEKLVSMMNHLPAKRFSVKNKGGLEVGNDADFTVVDLKKEVTLSNEMMATKSGWTPYHNKKVTGFPVMTYVRGHRVMNEGEVISSPSGQPMSF